MPPTPTPPPVPPPPPHVPLLFFLLPRYFYLNLPQICPSTKHLPSLFWAIMCGSAARVRPPGRQSLANRVSVRYCGVCLGRSITHRLTPCTGNHGEPAAAAGPLLESPLCLCTHRSGTRERRPRWATHRLLLVLCTSCKVQSFQPHVHSGPSREVRLFPSVLKAGH